MNSRRKERGKNAAEEKSAPAAGAGAVSRAAYATYFALAAVGGSIDLLTKQAAAGTHQGAATPAPAGEPGDGQ